MWYRERRPHHLTVVETDHIALMKSRPVAECCVGLEVLGGLREEEVALQLGIDPSVSAVPNPAPAALIGCQKHLCKSCCGRIVFLQVQGGDHRPLNPHVHLILLRVLEEHPRHRILLR